MDSGGQFMLNEYDSMSACQRDVEVEPQVKRTRKVPRNENKWQRNVMKEKRNKGLSYTTKKGKLVDNKTFQASEHICKKKA
jgi:hypothetical protein